MIHFGDELGQRALQRIQSEQVIWLTTVSASGAPQPRPVWFVWDGEAFTIYSTPTARKIAHIAQNPNVALHFNTDAEGDDVQVILGQARLDPDAPPSKLNKAYSEKYHAGILSLGLDEERYAAMFSAAIRVVPSRLRGLEPLPSDTQAG